MSIRILVGFNFPKAVREGIAHGRKIGNRAVNRFLKPIHHDGNHLEAEDPDENEVEGER
jgi:hypothetical protein